MFWKGDPALRALVKLAIRHRRLAALVLVTGIVTGVLEGIGLSLFLPMFDMLQSGVPAAPRSELLNRLSAPFDGLSPESRIWWLAGAILGVIVLRALLGYANAALADWLVNKVLHDIRCRLFDSILHVHFNFYERLRGGRIVNGLTTESMRTVEALKSLISIVMVLIIVVIYLLLLLLLSWQLALATAGAAVLVSLGTKRLVEAGKKRGAVASAANRNFVSRMLEVIEGMPVVRAFGQEASEYKRFTRRSSDVARAWYRMTLVSQAVRPINELVAAVLLLLVFITASRTSGDLSELVLFAFVLVRLQPRMIEMNRFRVSITSCAAAINETSALMRPMPGAQPSGHKTFSRLRQGIRFERVTYAYQKAKGPAVQAVDLTFSAGQFVALVGASGAGKTTMIKLLLRFYDPSDGRIWVDDDDLRDLDIDSWRGRIAIVAQENYIFNIPIADNIAYGYPEASREEVVAAAKAAHAHSFIEDLPKGYDTIVGDRGGRLSGGQKQRIALARAMIRAPELFVLDEATNQLDALTEKAVQETLMRLRERCTMVVIAHRLATVQHADKIIVMDGGRVIESGSYSELVAADGVFRRLVDAQLLATPETRDEVA